METELERLSKLKEDAKANRQKSKPCKECKKKKEVVTKLPNLLHEEVYIPSPEEVGLAYIELTNQAGVREDKREFINKVYNALFGKDFNFNCRGCGNSEVRRFTNYVNANNIKI